MAKDSGIRRHKSWMRELEKDRVYGPYFAAPEYPKLDRLGPAVALKQRKGEDAGAEWAELDPEIKRLEVQVLRFLSVPQNADVRGLIDEASVDVWEALGGYKPARPFAPWCKRVLSNKTISKLRKLTTKAGTSKTPLQLEDEACGHATAPVDEKAPRPLRKLLGMALRHGYTGPEESAPPEWVQDDIQTIRGWQQAEEQKKGVFEPVLWTGYFFNVLPKESVHEVLKLATQSASSLAERVRATFVSWAELDPPDFARQCLEWMAEFVCLTPRQFKKNLRDQHWRFFELRCVGRFLKKPTAGPDFWEEWSGTARKQYVSNDGKTAEPFPPKELAIIGKRKQRNCRLHFLTAFRIWLRTPSDVWKSWVEQDERAEHPFPPPAVTPDTPTASIRRQLIGAVANLGERRLEGAWIEGKRLFVRLRSLYCLFEWNEHDER